MLNNRFDELIGNLSAIRLKTPSNFDHNHVAGVWMGNRFSKFDREKQLGVLWS